MPRVWSHRSLGSSITLISLLLSAPESRAGAEVLPAKGELAGLTSFAEVEGPRGRFTTEIVSLADGRARLVQQHPGRRTELVVAEGRGFELDGTGALLAASAATASTLAGLVHGHDVPRLAHAALAAGARPERLERSLPPEEGGGTVTIELGDWRPVAGGLELPFAATFLAGGERFFYRYSTVLPFQLAPGAELVGGAADPALLFARLGDLGALVAAHEEVMEAHRASDAARLTAGDAERSTISGRGRLTETTRADSLARMQDYLSPLRFARYADTVAPVVALSADGTLAWLACEMAAEGTRTREGRSEPVAYGFSWVELYAKSPPGAPGARGAASWQRIGNASSQRP